MDKPFSQACENNKAYILKVLKSAFAPVGKVLEIGSGTGQHAVYFAEHLSHLQWQPSDLIDNHPGIEQWLAQYQGQNMLSLRALDMSTTPSLEGYDAVFSANTAHIMPWETTQIMLRQVAKSLPENGVFALYGPFNYGGNYTSQSNADFDQWLKQRAPHQGIRDFEAVNDVVTHTGLSLVRDHAMPANNRLLIWRKPSLDRR